MGGFFQQANDAAVAQSARNSVALAATPPVATGGDAATIAGLIEDQVTDTTLAGRWQYRKALTVRSPMTSETQTETVLVYLTDADVLAEIGSSADMRIADADGTLWDFELLNLTPTLATIGLKVPAHTTAGADNELYLYFANNGNSLSYPREAFGPVLTLPAAPLDLSFTTGRAIDPTIESVHPFVLKVPAGSWMASDGAGGTVTHVMVDTPYPGGDDDYEAVSLLYSTDNGATWAEWPGVTNPFDSSTTDGKFTSDLCLTILADGSLRVYYRETDDGFVYTDISGTNLTDVVVGTRTACTVTVDIAYPMSPSVVQVSPTLWYCFGTTSGGAYQYRWLRWTSTDGGTTWGDLTVIVPQWALPKLGGWHGTVTGPWAGGWYYLTISEVVVGANPVAAGARTPLRLFRSSDLTTWEMSPNMLLTPDDGTYWSQLYQSCIFERTDGQLGLVFSGRKEATPAVWRVGAVSPLPDLRRMWPVTSAVWFGQSAESRLEATEPTLIAAYDFAEASTPLADLSGNGNTATLINAPTRTADLGYVLAAASKQRVDTGISLASLGTQWAIEMDFTVPASLPGSGRDYILCDATGTSGALTALRLWLKQDDDADPGRIGFYFYNALAESERDPIAHGDLRGGRHRVRMQYSAGAADEPRSMWLFLDGIQIYASAVTADEAANDVGSTLQVGGMEYDSEAAHGNITVHSLRLYSSVPRRYTSATAGAAAPDVEWTFGRESLLD